MPVIVDFPIKNGDFPWLCKRLPEAMLVYQRLTIVNHPQVMVNGMVTMALNRTVDVYLLGSRFPSINDNFQ